MQHHLFQMCCLATSAHKYLSDLGSEGWGELRDPSAQVAIGKMKILVFRPGRTPEAQWTPSKCCCPSAYPPDAAAVTCEHLMAG